MQIVPVGPPTKSQLPGSLGGPSSSSITSNPPTPKICGFLYLCATILFSIMYLTILQPNVDNDFWWSHFNSTGIQTFLGDLYNYELTMNRSGLFSLEEFASTKSYATGSTMIDFSPSYGRQLLLDALPLDIAVEALRRSSLDTHIQSMTVAHCWVDFNKSFEVAMTTERQDRCNQSYASNAAVYLESLMRNIGPNDLTTTIFSLHMNAAFFNQLDALPLGQTWLEYIRNHTWLSLTDEVMYWERYQLKSWITPLQNNIQEGIEEAITIVNGADWTQLVTIKKIPFAGFSMVDDVFGSKTWTTKYAFPGLHVNLLAAKGFNVTLVRQGKLRKLANMLSWDYMIFSYFSSNFESWLFDLSEVPKGAVRSNIGPFGCIDIMLVPPPQPLIDATAAIDRAILSLRISSNDFRQQYQEISERAVVDPVPSQWLNIDALGYYGGNPMCMYSTPQVYVQVSFDYYNPCVTQDKLTITLDRNSQVMALLATNAAPRNISASCGLCIHDSSKCEASFSAAQSVLKYIPALGVQWKVLANSSIHPWDISMVQFIQNSNWDSEMLSQLMVRDSDPWSLFGWVTMYDWALGRREVYNFDGDLGNVVIMTERHEYHSIDANPLELPHNAGVYIWVLTVYVSVVLTGVVFVMLILGMRHWDQIQYLNLLQVNRIVGSVWIGRPLLLFRAGTAMIYFSTSLVTFTENKGLSQLSFTPHPFLRVMIVAGEATWFTYVLNDLLLPITKRYAHIYSPMSTILAWLILAIRELTDPLQPVSTIGRTCRVLLHGYQIQCYGSEIHIGDVNRAVWCVAVCGGSVFVCYVLARLFQCIRGSSATTSRGQVSHMWLGVPSECFFAHTTNDDMHLDIMCCIMSGFFPWGSSLFDIKLWTFVTISQDKHGRHIFLSTQKVLKNIEEPTFIDQDGSKQSVFHLGHRSIALFGLLYMCATIFSSYQYLVLTKSTLSNDYLWEGFNSSITQKLLTSWFNKNLQLTTWMPNVLLEEIQHHDLTIDHLDSTNKLLVSPLYAAAAVLQSSTLVPIISSLRSIDACKAPWIFTAFCYVDFKRTWGIAHTAKRQIRCSNETHNGAIYLESILRNIHFAGFMQCWGKPLDAAILAELRMSSAGQAWIQSTQLRETDSASEATFWSSFGIKHFTTDWQNFKQRGIYEEFKIKNAFGVSYPLTIKHIKGHMRLSEQTSMKLYWGLAMDLTYISTIKGNSTSLIRSSSRYAFKNTSFEMAVAATLPLKQPWAVGHGLVRDMLGPFGTIQARLVPSPEELRHLYSVVLSTITIYGTLPNSWFPTWDIARSVNTRPKAWEGSSIVYVGGSLLCDVVSIYKWNSMAYFTADGACYENLLQAEMIAISNEMAIIAVMLTPFNISANHTCYRCSDNGLLNSISHPCAKYISDSRSLLKSNFPLAEMSKIQTLASDVKKLIRDILQVEIMQYLSLTQTYNPDTNGNDCSDFVLAHLNLFDPTEPYFEFYSWLYLIDWLTGRREVISFEGDVGKITLLSGVNTQVEASVNALEIPLSLSYYIRLFIQYVTLVIFLLACTTSVYVIMVRGHIDGINMFELNRVGGLVWIGRPLLLLRGITAVALLSSSSLGVQIFGQTIGFESKKIPILTLLLSSGEVTWLTYILNDLFSFLTLHRTGYYSALTSFLASVASAALSFSIPVSHRAFIDRTCEILEVDLQLKCVAGVIEIGSIERSIVLIGIAFTSCLVSYGLIYIFKKSVSINEPHSIFLHSTAKYNFKFWNSHDKNYLDKASSFLNGVVTIEWSRILYLLDIKTWQTYRIDIQRHRGSFKSFHHVSTAIPMVE